MSDTESVIREFTVGWIEYNKWQNSLLGQLQRSYKDAYKTGGDGGTRGAKPSSRPTLDITGMEFYYDCAAEVVLVQNGKDDELLRRFRHTARTKLGYEVSRIRFANTSCPTCHGALEAASDGSSSVVCTQPGCIVEYKTDDWLSLLAAKDDIDG